MAGPTEEPKTVTANTYGQPGSTFIQWKGTELCADIVCPCGGGGHIDSGFAYYVECPDCHRVLKLGTEVTVTEVQLDEANGPKMLENG